MQIINQSIVEIKHGVIVHQVNCRGVMGAGLAKSLRTRYPVIFTRYQQFCQAGQFKLGMVQFVNVAPDLYVCNLAGQNGYGHGVHTDYEAVTIALIKLHAWALERSLPIYIPFNMGCGLAGGDWAVVAGLIKQHCPTAIVCKL